jgi:Ca2+-binding EF-hand superfamily protein
MKSFQGMNERGNEQRIRQTLLSFVQETHFDLVVRLTHFYDFFVQTYGSKGSAEDIWRVLTFLGWQRLTKAQVQKFIASLDSTYVCSDSRRLDRYSIRHIFREWLLHVCSTRELLHECFRHFDLDGNGYLNKEEIVKILYRTTEEERINLIQDVIEKLDSRIYFDDVLKGTKSERPSTAKDDRTSDVNDRLNRKVTITKVITEQDGRHAGADQAISRNFLAKFGVYVYNRLVHMLSNHLLLLLLAYTLYILIMFSKLPPNLKDIEFQ